MAASTLAPPLTRWPTFTRNSASAGRITSTRDPNLIRPMRWPRSSVSPSCTLNTMRRASSPAICLKVTSIPVASAHGYGILLVLLGRGGIHGVQILALLIVHTVEHAADGRAVHMHVKNAEEDADALSLAFRSVDRDGFCDQAVSGRDDQASAGGNGPLGIAEEPEKKSRQKDRSDAPRPVARKPDQHNRHRQQGSNRRCNRHEP